MAAETIEYIEVTRTGLTASRMIWDRFHRPMPGLVERVLDINPGMADEAFLPLGAVVMVPIPPADERVRDVRPVRLWGD